MNVIANIFIFPNNFKDMDIYFLLNWERQFEMILLPAAVAVAAQQVKRSKLIESNKQAISIASNDREILLYRNHYVNVVYTFVFPSFKLPLSLFLYVCVCKVNLNAP